MKKKTALNFFFVTVTEVNSEVQQTVVAADPNLQTKVAAVEGDTRIFTVLNLSLRCIHSPKLAYKQT